MWPRAAPRAARPQPRLRRVRRHLRRGQVGRARARAPSAESRRRRRLRSASGAPGNLKDALLAEIRAAKAFFYNTVVAQAQSIDMSGDRVAFTFLPTHRTLREQFEQTRPWIEAAAQRIAGRKVSVVSQQADAGAAAAAPASTPPLPRHRVRRPTARRT